MKNGLPSLAALACIFWTLMIPSAIGATITQIDNFNVTNGIIGSAITPLTFNQFDTSLGTLTSIQLTLSDQFSGTASITAVLGASYTGHIQDVFTLTDNGGTNPPPGLTSNLSNTNATSPDFSLTYTLAGLQTTGTQTAGNLQSSSTSLNGANLSSYSGLGTLNLRLGSTTSLIKDSGGGLITVTTSNTTGTGAVTLAYNYTATPEPSAVWLFLSGGIIIIGARIVRRKSACPVWL